MSAPKMDRRLLDALTMVRIARDRWHAAKREVKQRCDLSIEWMRAKPSRTVGDAHAYVGLRSAMDARRDAKRDLVEAVDSLLSLGADLDAMKAEGT